LCLDLDGSAMSFSVSAAPERLLPLDSVLQRLDEEVEEAGEGSGLGLASVSVGPV